jgi:hypothetical protein
MVLALPFTLTRGNALGMAAFLEEYFEAHRDPSSPEFRTGRLRRRARVADGRAVLVVQTEVFPTPYDLGVRQRCRVSVHSTDRAGIYAVRLGLKRLSSDAGSWLRTNFRFLDLVRKQFLIWRTIGPDDRRRYIHRGLELFG